MEIAGQDYANLASYHKRIQAIRAMTGEQRVALAFALWNTACEIARAGIQAQHSEFTREQVERELARRIIAAHGAARSTHPDR